MIKVLANVVFGESLPTGLKIAVFSLCAHIAFPLPGERIERGRGRGRGNG